ncbi:TMEM175 family protein [Actinopolymorpha singaporensis]|nr:TMEM175 family protein [Actinopolymorpha singaporensis]
MNAEEHSTRLADAAPAGENVGGNAENVEKADPGTERLVFFSDAVVAIAITLLALDLHVPQGTTGTAFWRDAVDHREDYLAFLISFAVIGSHWLMHHRTFTYLARLGGRLVRWNMLWLLTITLTPFATRVIVGDGAFAARFMLYALVQVLAATFSLLCLLEIQRHRLLRPGADKEALSRGYRRLTVMLVAFVVSIPLAFVTQLAYLCWVAIPFALRAEQLIGPRRPHSPSRR